MKSARALKEAADTMCESPAALQLRYLQVSFKTCFLRFKQYFASQHLTESGLNALIYSFSDFEFYCCGKEFYDNFPTPNWLNIPLIESNKEIDVWRYWEKQQNKTFVEFMNVHLPFLWKPLTDMNFFLLFLFFNKHVSFVLKKRNQHVWRNFQFSCRGIF